ncbi:outer membrane protein assembly factor BamB family protein [Micromonospora tarensis]|uniref:PQQ-like beta-propeller repeat protein n=1 Tax=Micromonospora tarensis TaxID=2806100 RepID=A0ABS1YDC5_9ACTN|nr:PQQ-binding-like beta-propeller repeat protein [Micromonospora tarensis]MBM0275410.1 PQQ-like beta-propeller repeat protein [Micromonospora tarensis]
MASGGVRDAPPTPAFRHDPVKSVLPGRAGEPVDWTAEPAVCGHRRMRYDNRTLGRSIAVPVSATPAVVAGVGVVAASDDGFVRLLDPTLRKEYWRIRLTSSVYASLVVDRRRRHVVVAATNGELACVDLRGRLVWSATAGAPVCATPTVLPAADLLVVAAFHSRCLAVDLGTGRVVFEHALPRPWHAEHDGVASYRDAYASPAATAAGTAIVCCAEHVLCLGSDGTERWRTELGHPVKASPVALHETGEVLVCTVDGRCLLLDAETGEIRRQAALGSKITASPAVSGGVAAVGLQHDVTVGLDVRSLREVWRSDQGGPRSYTSVTVLPSGDFVATTGRGNMLCLGRRDGAFRWESSQVLGLPDHEPAMDITPVAAPDGNAYCASYAGDLYRFRFRSSDRGKRCP